MSSSFKKVPDTSEVGSESTSSPKPPEKRRLADFALLQRQVFWLKTVVTVGLIAGLALSPKLWLSSRFYPLTPVWTFLKPFGFPFDFILFGGVLICLVAVGLMRRPSKAIAVFACCAILLALLDQSRWQPWFYQYAFMLISIGLGFRSQTGIAEHEKTLNMCRLMLVSIYFWSGLQKANSGFREDVFPWLIQPVTHMLPTRIVPVFIWTGLGVPFVELGIGLMLLSKRFRRAGVLLAVAMHFFILLAVGPWGQNRNTVIWSWNIVMAFCVVILFGSPSEFRVRDLLWPQKAVFHHVVLILFTVAPALSFFRLWDNYLSWALYAGNKNDAMVLMTDAVDEKLADEVEQYATDEGPDLNKLIISNWSYGELNVPAYPEVRIYKNVARTICKYADKSTDVKLIIQNKLALVGDGRQRTYDCSSLPDQ